MAAPDMIFPEKSGTRFPFPLHFLSKRFQGVREIPPVGRKFGEDCDVVWMHLRIKPLERETPIL
jgi:hypothetical protein